MNHDSRIRVSPTAFIDPLALRVEDVKPELVARTLAREARFSGMPEKFLSVAEHSLMVARLLARRYPNTYPMLPLFGLTHDAAEGLGFRDLSSPVKHAPQLLGYRDAIFAAQAVAYEALVGRQPTATEGAFIGWADRFAYEVEAACVWGGGGLAFLEPQDAEVEWLDVYWEMKGDLEEGE